MVKKRSIGLVVLLSIVTLGIYPIVALCIMGNQVNEICKGDGKKNMFYLLAGLLGIVTLGIYPVVWCAKAMNRLQDNSYRYGPTVHPANTGASFVLWFYLGSFIAVGPIVAFCKFVGNVNAYADIAGYIQPLPYTENQVERIKLAENNRVTPNYLNQQQIPQNFQGNPNVQSVPNNNFNQQNNSTATVVNNQVDDVPPTSPAEGYSPSNVNGTITGISGMYASFPFPIQNGEEVVIGSSADSSNIVINDNGQYVSARHCLIKYNGSGNCYTVIDYSTNGTFTANNIRLEKNVPKQFSAGEIIYLGNRDNGFRLG